MNILIPTVTFIVGFLLGLGAMILYIQYSMYSQMSDLEKHMDEMQNMAAGDFEFPDMEDETSEKEKKEEEE
ncbi:hypothetical protein ACK3SF_03355 [Candidatus Nanosalina sp. VS9-1]|uniref:hypothetical protein n=1 Tax=Candidatus Nanosalina sp. VS9-1 TaxID=3388566 RepID=UPI0039E1448D